MFEWRSWPGMLAAIGLALVAAVVVMLLVSLIAQLLGRRFQFVRNLTRWGRAPFRVLLAVLAAWAAVGATLPDREVWPYVSHGFLIAVIVVAAWFLGALVILSIDHAIGRFRSDPDSRAARTARTQLEIVRRLVIAIIVIIAISGVLLTFDAVRAVGTSLLASAGIISVIAGLAAQSTLGNVFAGIQLAFSQALRVDDVVVADGHWGRIEEMTLTYVVLKIWDDRRLVLPSTYFTTTPFENWTRYSTELLGAVELDLDWNLDVDDMRAHLDRVLENATLWDGRASVLQVTEATGGIMRVRILVTASDAARLFDLRCHVREEMVRWLKRQPAGLPQQRFTVMDSEQQPVADPVTGTPEPAAEPEEEPHVERPGLFTGSIEAETRGSELTQAIPIIRADDDEEDRPGIP
ncbi:mechanosensitive ion channel family protein [Salinibacterium sp. SYSU T00001]|uniref:mechanosensitive ion channel family protein n=1 Tax=Homoserinimonas sedimenticola TaxID=2986805 RepID=UPI00223566A4|nr:mechanosensitive ion channel family protein [Salinibacterium sedimenticola]MCW4385536.1 mechanosensitive ion channel family protein [Salinibacterium sedimenticola]